MRHTNTTIAQENGLESKEELVLHAKAGGGELGWYFVQPAMRLSSFGQGRRRVLRVEAEDVGNARICQFL